MAKMSALKAVLSLAVMAAAGSLMACSPGFTEDRNPHMQLSTPPMVRAKPMPNDSEPPPPPVQETTTYVTRPVVEGPNTYYAPTYTTPSYAPGSVVEPSDQQMLGQPGMGPAAMSPNMEAMPNTRMTTEGSYPGPSR